MQAFLANRASNASLSNAAAAAALRSIITSPVPVSEVRTKRTVKRQGSLSSNGSSTDNPHRPGGLQRRGSSGSMTERTFRDPSPNGGVPKLSHLEHLPPVPALPRGYASPPLLPVKSTRRSASSEPPERAKKSRSAGRGVSLDRGPGVMESRPAKGRNIPTNRLLNVSDQDAGTIRDSVNFSRPMSPQNSPAPSPLTKRHIGALAAPSASAFPSSLQPSPSRLRDSKVDGFADKFERPMEMSMMDKEVDRSTHLPSASRGSRSVGTSFEPFLPCQFSPGLTSVVSSSGPSTGSISDDAMPKPKKKKQVAPSRRENHNMDERPLTHQTSDSDTQSENSISDRPRIFNSRAARLLAKQPSIVREEPEAEEQEEHETSIGQINGQAAQTFGKSNTSEGGEHHVRFASHSVKASPLGTTAPNLSSGHVEPRIDVIIPQHQSLSPARAAHFSSQPILDIPEGAKHQPPLRSVSPAKSALKHSPSPRGPSPVASALASRHLRTHGRAASEASDTTSVTDDVSKAPKKKKAVRVSFDDDSVVATQAASPTTSLDSSGILGSQNPAGSSNGWTTGRLGNGEDDGSFTVDKGSRIQPTPALPVFGSVRVRKDEGGHGQSTDYRDSEYSSQVGTTASTDLALGDILAQHHKARGRLNASIAPEVRRVEGTGYHSDSGDSFMDENGYSIQPSTANGKIIDPGDSPSSFSTPSNHTSSGLWTSVDGGSIPEINILPATPGIDKANTEGPDWLRIPGQFPISTESLINHGPPSSPVAEHHATDQTPAEAGIAEPLPLVAIHEAGTTAVGSVADGLRAQIRSQTEAESDDSDDSIYSDAAEDLSDFEGDGFGSINAIVESPAAGLGPPAVHQNVALTDGSVQDIAFTKPSKHRTLRRNDSTDTEPDLEVDWTHPKSRPKSNQEDTTRPVSPRPSAMKRSMRSSPPEDLTGSQIRSSMRNNVLPNSQRNSVQSVTAARPKGALKKKSYLMSSIAMADHDSTKDQQPTGNMGQRSDISGAGAPSTNPRRKQATANLRRMKASDSDSSSSFQRLRPSTADSNRYTMKRSMRPGSADNQSQPLPLNGRGTSSVRSPSPNGRRPFSSAGSTMRTSMRGPVDMSKKPRTKSPSRFGFGKPAKHTPKISSKSGFSSRFADSSDEDSRPVKLRSRFEDSSDEDVPSRLTPVRGIPRRIDEGESTDLEDSSAEPSPIKKSKAHPHSTSKVQTLQGLTLAAGSLRSPSNSIATTVPKNLDLEPKSDADRDTKKRSFFGGLGTKKRDGSQIRSSDRKDGTPERPMLARLITAESKDFPSPKSAPLVKPPKLQRRNTPKRLVSNSWPLPDAAGSVAVQTQISGGISVSQNENGEQKSNGTSRTPNFGTKETVLRSGMQSGDSETLRGKAKKKRFPMLRKALRLNG